MIQYLFLLEFHIFVWFNEFKYDNQIFKCITYPDNNCIVTNESSEELKEYYIKAPTDRPVHIASVWERYGSNPNYFGGIVSFNREMFKQINGYPNNFWGWGGEDDETPVYGVVKIAIKAASGSTLTNATKQNIITSLQPYNVASVRPEIVDPETTSLVLTINAKYEKKATAKTSSLFKA